MEGKELKLERYYPELKKRKYPCIRVRTTGFAFNKPCLPAFNSKNFAEIFYDRRSKVIAIKPYHIETPYAIKTSGDRQRSILTVACRAFIKKNGILEYLKLEPYSDLKSKSFKAVWDDKNKWFLVDLKDSQV